MTTLLSITVLIFTNKKIKKLFFWENYKEIIYDTQKIANQPILNLLQIKS